MLGALLALACCAFLWPAVVSFDAGDWPSPNQFPHHDPCANVCGIVGAWCSYCLLYRIGDGVYPLLLFATLAATMRLTRGRLGHICERVLGLALVVACTSATAHLISGSSPARLPVGNGGTAGFALGELLTGNLSRVGTLVVLVSSLIVGVLFATQGWILTLPGHFRRMARSSGPAGVGPANAPSAHVIAPVQVANVTDVSGEEAAALESVVRPEPKINAGRVVPSGLDTKSSSEKSAKRGEARSETGPAEGLDMARSHAAEPKGAMHQRGHDSEADHPGAGTGRSGSVESDLRAEHRHTGSVYPKQMTSWRLPSPELLHDPEYEMTAKQEAIVREQARILEQTLQEFRLDAHVVEIDTGPVITMFELKLGAGIKVSQVATLSNDIARALKAHAIRVVAPISGKNTVGIEVPNLKKERVRLKELLALAGRKTEQMAVPLFLGKDSGGAAIIADLTAMPHLLIAGTTGSGKSVCLNAVILSLLMTRRPDAVKMIVIDPKMVEMSQYKDVPHLMCPIVTDLARAEKILEWAVTKMDERYAILAEAGVRNIAGYNRLGRKELLHRLNPADKVEEARISTVLPYIVIIIDELADLMMTAAKEVEHHLSRLAQKSRAVGIHIIVATQRPEAKVVTGLIKSNLPARICFRVASRMDSRIVLDQNGGEVLMGQGDMLFLPPGSHKLIRAQGTFLDDSEVRRVIEDLASRSSPEFHPELVRGRDRNPGAGEEARDPLFDDAVRIIIESRRGSVSLLQRRLTIGYSRASRLVDQMAEAGIVGEYKGSQAREVLLTLDEWEAWSGRITEDRVSDPAEDSDGAGKASHAGAGV